MKKFLCALMVIGCVSGVSFGAEVAPVVNASLLAGSNSFDGEASSLSGNLNLNIIPTVKFSETVTLVPLIYFEERRIKQVNELADGNILFQEGRNYNLALKPVISLNDNLKLGIKAGYFVQMLKEAASETLSDGAFNYNKTTAGFDISGDAFSVGYNMFIVQYPNYQTFSDKYTTITSSVQALGKDILDFSAHEVFVSKKLSLGAVMLDATLDYMIKSFKDQKLSTGINATDVSSDKRSDKTLLVNVMPSMALIPTGPTTLIGALGLTYVTNNSNQGYADTNGPTYTGSYYNYAEIKVAPMFNFSFNKIPLKMGIAYEMSMRNYTDRLAQDKAGTHTADKMYQNMSYIGLNISYPLRENLTVSFSPSFLTSSSNMKYESVYKYNYSANSFFLGAQYSYQ